jgi:hypothetical protein
VTTTAEGPAPGQPEEFSVDWACIDRELDAIDAAPKQVWRNGIEQDGTLLDDVWVADITGLLDPVRVDREDPWPADTGPEPDIAHRIAHRTAGIKVAVLVPGDRDELICNRPAVQQLLGEELGICVLAKFIPAGRGRSAGAGR